MSILFDLRNESQFTDSDRAISNYILGHMDRISALSINELAQLTSTSNASVIRLCRKLGFSGYRDFRIALLREIERVPEDAYELNVSYPFHDRTSPAIVMKNLLDVHRHAVYTCYTAVSPVDLQKAAFMIRKAERIFLYGMGESDLLAQIFARRIMRIGYMPYITSFYGESAAQSRNATERDLGIFLTYSGGAMLQYDLDLKVLQEKKCPTMLISSNKNLKGFTHRIIYPHEEEVEDNAATYYSTEAGLYILDSIYGILFAMDYENAKKEKNEMDRSMRARKSLKR